MCPNKVIFVQYLEKPVQYLEKLVQYLVKRTETKLCWSKITLYSGGFMLYFAQQSCDKPVFTWYWFHWTLFRYNKRLSNQGKLKKAFLKLSHDLQAWLATTVDRGGRFNVLTFFVPKAGKNVKPVKRAGAFLWLSLPRPEGSWLCRNAEAPVLTRT